MKLGTETGSTMNHLYSRATKGQPEPAVGMGITFLGWTDRHPGTICAVYTDGKENGPIVGFDAQEDDAVRVDSNGMSECQSYEFKPNPLARVKTYRRDRNGLWRRAEATVKGKRVYWRFLDESQEVRLGERDKYHDFSF
jgi:hypothetical protein